MSTPIDPEFENEILTAIREPLVAAIAGADARASARARTYRLLAAACVCVLIAGGAVAAWRSNRGGDTAPQIRVGPTTTLPSSSTTTPHAIVFACDGTDLALARSGATNSGSDYFSYLDLRNDSLDACAVPYPSAATATNDANQRVELAGLYHGARPEPVVAPGGVTRLILETHRLCARTGEVPMRQFRSLVLTVGGTPIPVTNVTLLLCDRKIGALVFKTPPVGGPPPSIDTSDPTRVDVGSGFGSGVENGTKVIHLRNAPVGIGSAIGNGVTETRDGRFLAYEFGSPVVHQVAIVDIASCESACTETVLGRGHSPVYSSDGTLAYVALDDTPPASATDAMWKRAGSVTVRAPDGTTEVWAHGTGMQTVGWAGDTLLVDHDVPTADTEGFEDLWLYREPGERTELEQGLVAISPDGARLLLAAPGSDQMLQLYDVVARRLVSTISIADYERALAPASELAGVDLTQWPGFENANQWPISCCEGFSGATLWHDDLVLLPMTSRVTHRTNGEPDRTEPRPTLIRIVGDRIVPLRALKVVGINNEYDTARWVPTSTSVFVLRRSDLTPPLLVRCTIDQDKARCNEDQFAETIFRIPATIP